MVIKWVLFDAMGVIFKVADDVTDLLVPYLHSKNNTLPIRFIYEEYMKASLGDISSQEFWTSIGHGSEYPDIETEYLDNWYTFDPEFIEIAEMLKIKYKLAFFSNDLKEWSRFLRCKHISINFLK